MKNIIKKYLAFNQYHYLIDEFEDLLQSHPNYPSLYAVTDTLTLLSIENIAIKIPKEQFEELPNQFVSIFKNELVLITKKKSKIQSVNENGKKDNILIMDFLDNWTGIVVVIEPNTNINLNLFKDNFNRLYYILSFIVLIVLSLFFNNYSFDAVVILINSLLGLFVSSLILFNKLGFQNETISNLCNINQNMSCNTTITSNKYKILTKINFNDLPFLFFTLSTLFLLFEPINSSVIIGFCSLLSIPIIIYSFWLQKVVLKKWCLLCLIVSIILLLQSLFFLNLNFSYKSILNLNFSPFILTSIIVITLWLFLKPIMESKFNLEKKNTELNKFKRDFKIFQFFFKDIQEYNNFEKIKGINYGNEKAPIQLSLFLSPNCNHCHKAFEEAYDLVQKFPNKIQLNIFFNINPENENNPYKIVVEILLALNFKNQDKARQALIDLHINKYNLEDWKIKWNVDLPITLVIKQMQNQYDWCLKNEFNFTPVKILNGKLFPNVYEINELRYFINEF